MPCYRFLLVASIAAIFAGHALAYAPAKPGSRRVPLLTALA